MNRDGYMIQLLSRILVGFGFSTWQETISSCNIVCKVKLHSSSSFSYLNCGQTK